MLIIKWSFIRQGQCSLKLWVAKCNHFTCKNKVWLKETQVSLQMKLAWKESLSWKGSALSLLLCFRPFLCSTRATPGETALPNASLEWFWIRNIAVSVGLFLYWFRSGIWLVIQSHKCFLSLKNEIWDAKTQKMSTLIADASNHGKCPVAAAEIPDSTFQLFYIPMSSHCCRPVFYSDYDRPGVQLPLTPPAAVTKPLFVITLGNVLAIVGLNSNQHCSHAQGN